jgi:hypothetical protein
MFHEMYGSELIADPLPTAHDGPEAAETVDLR